MNFVGKILVVLIFAMSLVFMSFAVAVYGTHQNWKTKAQDEAKKVAAAQAELAKYQEEENKLKEQIKAEVTLVNRPSPSWNTNAANCKPSAMP